MWQSIDRPRRWRRGGRERPTPEPPATPPSSVALGASRKAARAKPADEPTTLHARENLRGARFARRCEEWRGRPTPVVPFHSKGAMRRSRHGKHLSRLRTRGTRRSPGLAPIRHSPRSLSHAHPRCTTNAYHERRTSATPATKIAACTPRMGYLARCGLTPGRQ